MRYQVIIPQLGSEPEAATLVNWEKAEGDTLQKGDTLYALESSKVVSEITADHAGILTKILVEEGSQVMPGTLVAEIEDSADVNLA